MIILSVVCLGYEAPYGMCPVVAIFRQVTWMAPKAVSGKKIAPSTTCQQPSCQQTVRYRDSPRVTDAYISAKPTKQDASFVLHPE